MSGVYDPERLYLLKKLYTQTIHPSYTLELRQNILVTEGAVVVVVVGGGGGGGSGCGGGGSASIHFIISKLTVNIQLTPLGALSPGIHRDEVVGQTAFAIRRLTWCISSREVCMRVCLVVCIESDGVSCISRSQLVREVFFCGVFVEPVSHLRILPYIQVHLCIDTHVEGPVRWRLLLVYGCVLVVLSQARCCHTTSLCVCILLLQRSTLGSYVVPHMHNVIFVLSQFLVQSGHFERLGCSGAF